MPTSLPNLNYLAKLFRRYRVGPKLKMGAVLLPRRPLADNFLYRALVLVNAYKYAKFQLPSSVTFGDMEGSQNKNWELLISPGAP